MLPWALRRRAYPETGPPMSSSWPLVDVDYSSDESISHSLDGVDAVVHCAIADDFRGCSTTALRVMNSTNYVALTEWLARIADADNRAEVHLHSRRLGDWTACGTS